MKARIPGAQNQGNMMKRIQQMQEDMQNAQAEVENSEFTATAGGGAVEVTVSGSHEVRSIKMQPDIVDPEDIEMLEDMIVVAMKGYLLSWLAMLLMRMISLIKTVLIGVQWLQIVFMLVKM